MTQIRYTKEHEWIRIDGAEGVCGITDYAQKALGDVVYVELPPIGKVIKKGEQTCVVESAKAASEVYAPLPGQVVAVNDVLTSDPAKINSSPADEGWFFKLKLSPDANPSELMDDLSYESYVKGLQEG